ncbi:MAG: transglutaminase family protein [Pseudomonadales bacterium]|nr:transglutaminase family protein [Pseudomonadales bacterium]
MQQNTENNGVGASSEYLLPSSFIDSTHPAIIDFVQKETANASGEVESVIMLYLAIRDGIIYDPYFVGREESYYRASNCLLEGRGFCIPKAALLAAGARVLGVPARVGYADVKNHLTTEKLDALVGSNLYRWHSYTELYLNDQWVKATPAFNKSLCERFGVHTLEFDGKHDSLLQEFDCSGRQHMEYVHQRGSFQDVPYPNILRDFVEYHPRWLDNLSLNGDAASTDRWG